jgi:hypothetical protein
MLSENRIDGRSRSVTRRDFIKNASGAGAALAWGHSILGEVPSVPASDAGSANAASEWNYEQAGKLWKGMTRAVQHVGVPGCQWQTGVMWDGALVFGPLQVFRNNPAVQAELRLLGGGPADNVKVSGKYDPGNLLHLSIAYGESMRFADRRGMGSTSVRHRLEGGRLPLPQIETTDGMLLWSETVFAHLLGRRSEEGMQPKPADMLVTHAVFKVRNRGAQAALGRLWLHFADASEVTFGYKCAQGDKLGQALAHKFDAPFGVMAGGVRYVIPAPAKGKVVWHADGATPEGMKNAAQNLVEWQVPLAAGEEAEFRILLPYGLVDFPTAQRILGLDSSRLFDEVRNFWQSVVNGQISAISTPDSFVNDYVSAVVGQMAEQTCYRHNARLWMYKTSPNWYEAYWPCNAAKALPTLDLRGLTRYSRPVLASFVATQTDDFGRLQHSLVDGKKVAGESFARVPGFLGNFGDWTANTLLLSHGLELWALASHYRITRDREWLGEGHGSPLQTVIAACDWLSAQRRLTMREENGRKVAHWGLLPSASAHDWFAGYTIFNDAFCIFGMIESVRMLREINHPRAEELAKELNDYRNCLRERYREARDRARPLPLPDGRQLPYVPREVSELDWAKPDWTYTGYGPLRAGAWGALDPHDELVNQALEFLEAGMPKGEGYYFPPDSGETMKDKFGRFVAARNFADVSDPNAARHFLWRHYVEYETMWPIGFDLFLQRDDLPRFFEWFFNNLAVVIHHDYRVGVESLDGVPSCAPGDGERWRAIRDMFVNERGGYDGSQQSLWLLQAIPRSWLKPGSRLSAKQMGTHFGGQVDLETEVAKDGNSVSVSAKLNLAVLPTEIRMRLRSGNGRPLASVSINGQATGVLEKNTIKLPKETKGEYQIVGRFA